jgi:hypothetical protein
MIYPTRVVPLASLLLLSIAVQRPSGGTAQGSALTAEVGKTVFFEDEPIFLLLRLTNVGSDTAWVMDFAAISMAVQMSLRRDGEPVPVGGLWIGYVCLRSGYRCGDPLAPGESRLTAGILQDRAGDQKDFKRSLLRGHLGPGEYELRVSTHGAEAVPIAFHVRERSATETKDLKELEAIQSMMRDQPPTPYEGAQISWVARHPPDDPFFPFLLAQWLYFPGTMEGVDLDSLRSVVLRADRYSPAGAYLAQSMEGWRPEQLAAMVEPLGTSLAGEIAGYLVKRRQHKQR